LNEQLLQKYNGKLEVVCNYLASVWVAFDLKNLLWNIIIY
jgi:hypothetical protein